MTEANHTDDFEDIDLPVDEEDGELAVEGEFVLEDQPGWAKALAWATIAVGTIYLINPTAGFFELLPDNLPLVGNLDEAAAVFIIFAAMRYLGMRLPEFIERWTQYPAGLPASTHRDDEE